MNASLLRFSLFAACLFAASHSLAAPTAEIQTTQGTIVVELDSAKAPKTVENFVGYAKKGFYDATIFHRVIGGFMIQGGGLTKDMAEKPTGTPVTNEGKNGLKNLRGTIAMARTSAPHSATAQFFINHQNNSSLDYPSPDGWGYAVFGKVVRGMDIVDKIARVPTGDRYPHRNVPLEPVLIKSIKIIEKK
ncbi:MAG: peptidyl-prolyl cis-trans isomerase [Candidatus Accumulibacter sp.]|jgi:cyclophilin family peptidyl-prolyl cis-trans isomerase|nr:peptidyl-prolyl cis-trans isomerase [Accumulibacter sp.]